MTAAAKTDAEIEKIRAACRLASRVLDHVAPFVVAGATTADLDRVCHDFIAAADARPAPLHYAPPGHTPFPKSICASVNHQVCHGVPSDERHLKDGDILNLDVTVIKDGFHGDTGRMFFVGEPSVLARRLCEVTRECLDLGIAAARDGNRIGDIGAAIQQHAHAHRFSVVREYCGHGLGRNFHEPPQVPHFGIAGTGEPLRENMIFTIEPMINAGKNAVKTLADGWTVVTRDRQLSAQWEHTVRVTKDAPEVLTLSA